ncbi:MAG: 7-cyano-7-deazaguanine synthase [Candidatus Omnitrophica bacterium]|nr:7-cyano-7-deazaguanine synthase [Candidatus Omnitrophota bacterium]
MSKLLTPICVLASGGLDSAALLIRCLKAGGRVAPLYLRCGFVWEAAELHWLRRFLRSVRSPRLLPLQVLDVPLRSTYGAHWSLTGRRVPGASSADEAVYLPGRNVLLLAHAAVRCAQRGITTIAIGTLAGNPFGDGSPRFFRGMSACLSLALRRPIRVLAPLRRLTKPALIRATPGVPWALTFSCLRPRGRRHCGRCNKCAERRRAFR